MFTRAPYRHLRLILTAIVSVSVLAWLLPGLGVTAQEQQSPYVLSVPSFGEPSTIPRSLPFGSDTYQPLGAGPFVFQTNEYKIRVVPVVAGVSRPWSLAFLPNGDMLFTERTGQLRIIRSGVLDPQPIAGIPEAVPSGRSGLEDIVLHPKFAENGYVYLTYAKAGPGELAAPSPPCEPGRLDQTCPGPMKSGRPTRAFSIALARGRFDGRALTDVKDLLIADWTQSGAVMGSRLAFGKDGLLYMTVSSRADDWNRAQKLDNLQGKVLRLRDDGTPAMDNPFVKTKGARPEIFTLGHRNPLGLAIHPVTGVPWEVEMGPQGGDELNMLLPGRNYGWPKVSMGRDYSGTAYPPHGSVPGFESPVTFWVPAIAPSGLMFYTGDKFPKWKNNIFLGSMTYTHLERIGLNDKMEPIQGFREWLLIELKQRIRDVRQGPDGYIYVLTDASKGAILRIEPAE